MKHEISINVNHFVKIKLTDFGKEVYAHQNDELNKFIKSHGAPPLDPRKLDSDEEGYVRLQLWEFMNIFGDAMHMGSQPVIECNTMLYEFEPERDPSLKEEIGSSNLYKDL